MLLTLACDHKRFSVANFPPANLCGLHLEFVPRSVFGVLCYLDTGIIAEGKHTIYLGTQNSELGTNYRSFPC